MGRIRLAELPDWVWLIARRSSWTERRLAQALRNAFLECWREGLPEQFVLALAVFGERLAAWAGGQIRVDARLPVCR